jgi:hypothetical protein
MSYMFSNATKFNKDLSGWCVNNITSLPEGFSINSGLASEYMPKWSTCPT